MILNKHDLDKVRLGLYRCTRCGDYYDPTNRTACPYCGSGHKFTVANIAFAVVTLLFLLLWLPLKAGAQVGPVPTAVPTVAAAPTISPLPQCAEVRKVHCVWLPIGAK